MCGEGGAPADHRPQDSVAPRSPPPPRSPWPRERRTAGAPTALPPGIRLPALLGIPRHP
ncbi:protein of unknown function [Streptomyces murinus]